MGIPTLQKWRIGTYLFRQLLARKKRLPLVLMLEPTFRCNLSCRGCGKIAHSAGVIDRQLSVEECTAAAEECGAPVVSIPGGEPLTHPGISRIVAALTARRRFVYLCTNALLVEKRLPEFTPSPYLTFSIHLDGDRERHDELVGRAGTFDAAVAAIRLLIARGFRVTTNTTFFSGDTPERAGRFFDRVMSLGVEGVTVAPGFGFSGHDVGTFLSRSQSQQFFRALFDLGRGRGWRFNHSVLYLDFLAGLRTFDCTPWGTPTRNVLGWQTPCYLLEDGTVQSYRELLETTDWERLGPGRDPRCSDCRMHCGFEPSAVLHAVRHPWEALRSGARHRAVSVAPIPPVLRGA